jgi:hypothetical protein
VCNKVYIVYYCTNSQAFRHIAAQSLFLLSPRGNGATSFRIFEALEHGSIPVYIFDDHCCLPFSDLLDWEAFAVLVHAKEMAFLPGMRKCQVKRDPIHSKQRPNTWSKET